VPWEARRKISCRLIPTNQLVEPTNISIRTGESVTLSDVIHMKSGIGPAHVGSGGFEISAEGMGCRLQVVMLVKFVESEDEAYWLEWNSGITLPESDDGHSCNSCL